MPSTLAEMQSNLNDLTKGQKQTDAIFLGQKQMRVAHVAHIAAVPHTYLLQSVADKQDVPILQPRLIACS